MELAACDDATVSADAHRLRQLLLNLADNAVKYNQPDGAISMALETPWLACDNIWWAGFCPSDIDRFGRTSDLIRFADTDHGAPAST